MLHGLFRYDLASKYNEPDTVFSTRTDSLLRTVTYIGENMVQLYAVSELTPQLLQLPFNINCTNHPTLYPLNIREAFLMHCMSESGPTLYVVTVPVSPDKTAQTIVADGVPYSSLDGTYILVVDGTQLTVYSSADTRVPVSQKRLPGEIESVANLDNENVRLLTENGEHVVMNLKNTLAEPRYMPGGTPVLSEWVDSSNHYIYLTEGGTLYVINETSTHPLYELEVVGNWSLILFMEGTKPEQTEPTQQLAILNLIMMVVYIGLITVVVIIIVTCMCKKLRAKRKRKATAQQSGQQPVEQAGQQPSQQEPDRNKDSKATTNIEQKPSPAWEDAIQKAREILAKPTPPEQSLVNKEIVVNLENNDEKIQHEAPLPEADGVPLLEAQAL